MVGDEQDIPVPEQPRVPGEMEPDFDTYSEVVMAINVTERQTVGCAYYVAREEKLYFMEDARSGGANMVDSRM
jgi:DNA mismatch repair protein MSH5